MNKKIIITGIALVGFILTVGLLTNAKDEILGGDEKWTDAEWAEDTKEEGLNYRFDYELEEMKVSLESKFERVQEPDYIKATQYPEAIEWELVQRGFVEPELTVEKDKVIAQLIDQYNRILISIERVDKEIDLRERDVVDRTEDILSVKPSTPRAKEEYEKL